MSQWARMEERGWWRGRERSKREEREEEERKTDGLLAMKMEEVTMEKSYLEPPEGTLACQLIDLGPRKRVSDF